MKEEDAARIHTTSPFVKLFHKVFSFNFLVSPLTRRRRTRGIGNTMKRERKLSLSCINSGGYKLDKNRWLSGWLFTLNSAPDRVCRLRFVQLRVQCNYSHFPLIWIVVFVLEVEGRRVSHEDILYALVVGRLGKTCLWWGHSWWVDPLVLDVERWDRSSSWHWLLLLWRWMAARGIGSG